VSGKLNPITQMVFDLADNIVPFWIGVRFWLVIVVVIFTALSSSPAGRRAREQMFLRVPALGRLYRNSTLSRMAEAMALLVGAGCDIPEALRLGAVASGSSTLGLESDLIAQQVERERISSKPARAPPWCRGSSSTPSARAQRNELQDNLYSLGEMYADQARARQVPPPDVSAALMIVIIGGVIATLIPRACSCR